MSAGASRMRAGRTLSDQFVLTVQTSGALTLPARITRGLRVVPGDLFSLHTLPDADLLTLKIYHKPTAADWEAVSPVDRWRYLSMTALDRRRTLAIPEELFPLRKGENVWLWVMSSGPPHNLLLFRSRKSEDRTGNGDNGAYAAAGSLRDVFAVGGFRGPAQPPAPPLAT